MSDVIQCPQCDKKFRLPARVPATFTCTNCDTVMDLSDFGGGDRAESAEASAPEGRTGGGGAPQSRRSRAQGSGRGGRRSAGGSRRSSPAPSRSAGGRGRSAGRRGGGRGRAAPEDDYDDEPRGRRGRQQKSNAPIIIGSVAALMVAVVLVVISMKKKDDELPVAGAGTAGGPAKTAAAGANPGTSGTPAAGAHKPAGTAAAGGQTPAAAGGTAGAADAGTESLKPIRKPGTAGKGRYKRMSKVKLETFPWPEEIDAEAQAKAEEGIKAMYLGGRDWDDAQEWFVAQGRPICGRLISEFKTIQDTTGLENPEGKSYVGALDSVLRKIDGWMERKWKELDAVRASSHPNKVIGSCRRWTWWWKYEEWKNNPRKPWDPFEDESDDTDTGIKAPEKKKSKKGKGFGARAGGG